VKVLCGVPVGGVVEGTVVAPGDALVGVVGVVGTVVVGTVVVGTVVVGTVAAGVVGAGAVAAGTVTVVGAGFDSGVSSSVTSATAIPAASKASTTHVSTTGTRQLGGGWTRVRAASPHSRHQP
jgi:hypothetical protein